MNHVAHLAAIEISLDDQYKDTRKAYNKFVREGKYCEAIDLVINAFKLDENVKGLYGISISDDPTEMMSTNTAEGADWIEVHKSLFRSNTTFSTFTRMLYHEFIHVYQVQVMGLKDYDTYHYFREFQAHLLTVSNKYLPPADYGNQQYWTEKVSHYWSKLTYQLKAMYLTTFQLSMY